VSIPKEYHTLFENLVEAASDGSLALVETKDRASGAVRYVLAIVAKDGNEDEYVMTVLGHLVADPLREYDHPLDALDEDITRSTQ
jgi:hypothetical protein